MRKETKKMNLRWTMITWSITTLQTMTVMTEMTTTKQSSNAYANGNFRLLMLTSEDVHLYKVAKVMIEFAVFR